MASSKAAVGALDLKYQELQKKHQELQNRILSNASTQRILRKLTKAGADQGRLLEILASAVSDTTWWYAGARRQTASAVSTGDLPGFSLPTFISLVKEKH